MMSKMMEAASVLPTPPSSPSAPSRKSVIIRTASTTIVPAISFLNPGECPHGVSQAISTRRAPDISTTNIPLSPPATITKPVAVSSGSTPLRTIAMLKAELRIIDWQCGAKTKKNTECRFQISKENRQHINSQLETMICLTRAFPDFESALLKLVMLVHCYQHRSRLNTEPRLEAWRRVFPPGSADGSEPEIPVDQRISKALGKLRVECIFQGNGWACKRSVGGQKVQNCERTLQEIVKQDTYSSDAKLELLLKVLEWNRTCSMHENSNQFTWVAAWKKSVIAVLPVPKTLVDQAITHNTPGEPQTAPRAHKGPPIITIQPTTENKELAVMQINVPPSPRASPSPAIILDADLASYWPKAYDTSPFEILAHANHLASPVLSYKRIRSEVSRPLDAKGPYNGYMYAYEVDGNSGYVKIGYTTRSVTDRHLEWSIDCNRQTKSLYPPLPAAAHNISSSVAAATTPAATPIVATAVPTPHVRRVEALCHAELDHRRIRIYCGACLKDHIEWFQVSAAEVTAVIQKWSRWMATQPYELLQLRNGSKWVLKTSEAQRIVRFEQFMQELAVAPAP